MNRSAHKCIFDGIIIDQPYPCNIGVVEFTKKPIKLAALVDMVMMPDNDIIIVPLW